ncbi:MAG TPA: ABC transporter permease [Natronoarchaeum rubrum]|nr:ABC transporter permease [Natronoarchaeum rubrum]
MSFGLPVGARALLKREIQRYLRRYTNTFAPPLITNVLYFSVFGVILGGRIDQIQGFDYIVFLLPGLVVLGMISNAFENASFSIFHGRWNEYIHETLTSPLSYSQMVAAYVVASALRGVLVGVLIAAIGVAFTLVNGQIATVTIAQPLYLAAFGLIVPTLFSGFGVIGGLLAEDFDHLTVMNQFILRPLVFFGAVFYSLETLPGVWRDLSLLNPMVYMVDGVRYGFLGYSDVDPRVSLVVLSALTIAVLFVDVQLFKRGYGLTD